MVADTNSIHMYNIRTIKLHSKELFLIGSPTTKGGGGGVEVLVGSLLFERLHSERMTCLVEPVQDVIGVVEKNAYIHKQHTPQTCAKL